MNRGEVYFTRLTCHTESMKRVVMRVVMRGIDRIMSLVIVAARKALVHENIGINRCVYIYIRIYTYVRVYYIFLYL